MAWFGLKVRNMKLKYSLLLTFVSLSAVIMGCDRADDRSGSVTHESLTTSTNTLNRDADNTGINARDRDTNNLTAGDQGNSSNDRDITQRIRRALTSDSTYSTTAKNVKIITVNGRVTLRGPVNSDAEKSGIEKLAKDNAGEGNVDDQLEVKSQP